MLHTKCNIWEILFDAQINQVLFLDSVCNNIEYFNSSPERKGLNCKYWPMNFQKNSASC